jgi:hypothetical protein
MLENFIELGLCLLIGLAAVAVIVWEVATGRIANLDGITLALISLTLGAFFMFDLYWSYHTGELEELLKSLREGKSD